MIFPRTTPIGSFTLCESYYYVVVIVRHGLSTIAHGGLELLASRNVLPSASQAAGTVGLHDITLSNCFLVASHVEDIVGQQPSPSHPLKHQILTFQEFLQGLLLETSRFAVFLGLMVQAHSLSSLGCEAGGPHTQGQCEQVSEILSQKKMVKGGSETELRGRAFAQHA